MTYHRNCPNAIKFVLVLVFVPRNGYRTDPNQLDSLPLELFIEVLLQLDIPSLTRFRGINRRTMELVNSVHQYTAIIEHCPNIIRAIVSIQADAFDCRTLYRTLCTSRCSTCNRFGDHLYLIDCRRVPTSVSPSGRNTSPSQVAKHTGSSPPMIKAPANSSSWRNHRASSAFPGGTVML